MRSSATSSGSIAFGDWSFKEIPVLDPNKHILKPMLFFEPGSYGCYSTSPIIVQPGELFSTAFQNFSAFFRNTSKHPIPVYGWKFVNVEAKMA